MSTKKMMIGLLSLSMISISCKDEEKAGGEAKNNAQNNAQTGYECPTASDEVVDIATTAEEGLGLNFKMPKDLQQVAVGPNENTGAFKLVRFERPFTVTKNAGNYPQRLLRIDVERMELGSTNIFIGLNPPPYKPYGLGTANPADGSEPTRAMDAGTMEIDGKSVMIFREAGEKVAKFVIVREVDSKFYQITVKASVLKAAPVIITDIKAECARTYDPIALAVIKSIVVQ